MKVAKIALGVVFLFVLSAVWFLFNRDPHSAASTASQSDFTQINSGRRGDDPVYAEEIRKNTALTIQTRDHQRELENQLKSTLTVIKEEGRKQKVAAQRQVKELELKIRELKNADNSINSDELADKVKLTFDSKLAELTETVTSLNQLIEQNASNTQDAIAQIRQEYQSKDVPVNAIPQIEIPETPTKQTITYPYGYKAARPSGNQSSQANGDAGEDTSVMDYLQSKINNMAASTNQLVGSNSRNESQNQRSPRLPTPKAGKPKKWSTIFPVYTLPPNTVLSDSTLITPMIARVPLGGEVKDPFFFKVEIGGENLAANGHKIPGIAKMIASGYSTGVREQSCARGYIDSVTFIFIDGRIVTHGKATGSSQGDNNSNGGNSLKIGYLADQWGKPCIRGKYINNAKDYLLSRGGAAFIEAAAQGLSQSQVSYKQDKDGGTQAVLDGNVWQYILGQGIGGTANEVAEYVRERVSGAFDVVYVEQNYPVQIFLDQMLPIDYDSEGRMINYYAEPEY